MKIILLFSLILAATVAANPMDGKHLVGEEIKNKSNN